MNRKKLTLILLVGLLAFNLKAAEESTDTRAVPIAMNNELPRLVLAGKVADTWQALECGADADVLVDSDDFKKVPLLHCAFDKMHRSEGEEKKRRKEILSILLNKCKKPDAVNNSGVTLLGEAVSEGYVDIVRALLDRNADVDLYYRSYFIREPLLHHAFDEMIDCPSYYPWGEERKCREEIFSLLLDRCKNPHAVASNGWTLLGRAVELSDVKRVQALLNRGAKPDVAYNNDNKETILCFAFRKVCEWRAMGNVHNVGEAWRKEVLQLICASSNSIRSRLLKKRDMPVVDENSVDVFLRQSGLIRAKSNLYLPPNA